MPIDKPLAEDILIVAVEFLEKKRETSGFNFLLINMKQPRSLQLKAFKMTRSLKPTLLIKCLLSHLSLYHQTKTYVRGSVLYQIKEMLRNCFLFLLC